jgi:hypothetical protein
MVPTKFGIAFTAKFMNQVTHHETSGNLSIVIGVCGSTEFFVFFMSDVRKSLKDVI